jgi:hypothetical protein
MLRDLLDLLNDEEIIRLRHRAKKKGKEELSKILNEVFYQRESHEKNNQPNQPDK